MNALVYAILSIVIFLLVTVGGYFLIRLWTYGYYKSKKDFLVWMHLKQPQLNRRKGDKVNE